MNENLFENRGGEEKEKKILNPDKGIAKGGLPGDLWNSVASVYCELELLEKIDSEENFRNSLREIRNFEDYYRGQVLKYSEAYDEEYDVEKSIEAQKDVINNEELILEFNKKVEEIRKLADIEDIEVVIIELKRIAKEIYFLIYNRELNI